MKEFFYGLLATFKVRYYVIFHYASKNAGYIFLKTLCLILFLIPFIVIDTVDFVVETILIIPTFIPIIGLPIKLVCMLLGMINSIVFTLTAIADVIYDTENQKLLEIIANSNSQNI